MIEERDFEDNDDNLKPKIISYLMDIKNVRYSKKKKELYNDLFLLIFSNKNLIKFILNDLEFAEILKTTINEELIDIMNKEEFNHIYNQFSKLFNVNIIFETGRNINTINL